MDFAEGIQIVTSQPFIKGDRATDDQIEEYFNMLGFQRDGGSFVHPFKRLRITDVKGKNVLIDDTGEVFPIDVHVETNYHQ